MENESMTLPKAVMMKYYQKTFVETGTFDGRTVQMALDCGFDDIFSVETDLNLYMFSSGRFSDFDSVEIIHGNSEWVLPQILAKIQSPCLFWLDAHVQENYQHGEHWVPLLHELEIISKDVSKFYGKHTIMIDDMRCIGKCPGWENITKEQILSAIFKINPDYTIVYEDSKAAEKDIMVAFLQEQYLND
jgi:hypothetical protein